MNELVNIQEGDLNQDITTVKVYFLKVSILNKHNK